MLREQREEIFNSLVTEDSKYDSEMKNFGPEYVKSMRKVEILKSQLKHGKITKEEFDKEYEKIPKIKKKFGRQEFEISVPKTGKKEVELKRSNKNKPDDSLKTDIKNFGNTNGSTSFGKPNKNMNEKINHYANILKSTENYNDYKQAFKNLARIMGVPNACTIKILSRSTENNDLNYQCFDKKKSAGCTRDTKLYHTSKQKGLTRLNGKYRGSEMIYFSSKRVYFHKGNPGGRITSSEKGYNPKAGEYIYEYTGDPTSAFVDPEIGGSAVFIETDTSVPVRDVTAQFMKNK